jgi:hypothetical protein
MPTTITKNGIPELIIGVMLLMLKHTQRAIIPLLMLLALAPTKSATAQIFDQFSLVGDHSGIRTGFVTSISFDAQQRKASIQFLNVAGGSEEFTAQLTESTSIQSSIPVFLPSVDFLQPPPASLDLSGVEFLQGALSASEGSVVPTHWFRLTYFDDQWSGAFRVDQRIYSIDRQSTDSTVTVRPVRDGLNRRPDSRIRVSAVIDENYIQTDSLSNAAAAGNQGHLSAIESIHILDGLLTDGLGITAWLEQVIYQPATILPATTAASALLAGAETWNDTNADVFGLDDNLAVFFFRGGMPPYGVGEPALQAYTNDHIAIIGSTPDYQFATAHAMGGMLGLPYENNTLQQWHLNSRTALPDVFWSDSHRQHLSANPLPASLTQSISYDAPEIADQPSEQTAVAIDEALLIAEQPESGGLISNDAPDSTPSDFTANEGAGALVPFALLLLLAGQRVTRRNAHNR